MALNDFDMELSEDNQSYMLWLKVPKQSRYVRGLLKLITTLGTSNLSMDERRIVTKLTDSWKKLMKVLKRLPERYTFIIPGALRKRCSSILESPPARGKAKS